MCHGNLNRYSKRLNKRTLVKISESFSQLLNENTVWTEIQRSFFRIVFLVKIDGIVCIYEGFHLTYKMNLETKLKLTYQAVTIPQISYLFRDIISLWKTPWKNCAEGSASCGGSWSCLKFYLWYSLLHANCS